MQANCCWHSLHGVGLASSPPLLPSTSHQSYPWPLCQQQGFPKHPTTICCSSVPCSSNLGCIFWRGARLHSVNNVTWIGPGGASSKGQRLGGWSWQWQSRWSRLIQDTVWHPTNQDTSQVSCFNLTFKAPASTAAVSRSKVLARTPGATTPGKRYFIHFYSFCPFLLIFIQANGWSSQTWTWRMSHPNLTTRTPIIIAVTLMTLIRNLLWNHSVLQLGLPLTLSLMTISDLLLYFPRLDFQFKCHAGLLVIASIQHLILLGEFVIFACHLQ